MWCRDLYIGALLAKTKTKTGIKQKQHKTKSERHHPHGLTPTRG